MRVRGAAKIEKKTKIAKKTKLEDSQIHFLRKWKQAMKTFQGPSRQFLNNPPKLMKVLPTTTPPPRPIDRTWPKGRHYNRFTKRTNTIAL